MSILIKGMEMPKNCDDCFLGDCYCDKCQHIDGYRMAGGLPYNCPLVPVPPHGRLIDADALDRYIYNDVPLKVFGNIARMAEMRNIVDHAPTIIEAEGEE